MSDTDIETLNICPLLFSAIDQVVMGTHSSARKFEAIAGLIAIHGNVSDETLKVLGDVIDDLRNNEALQRPTPLVGTALN